MLVCLAALKFVVLCTCMLSSKTPPHRLYVDAFARLKKKTFRNACGASGLLKLVQGSSHVSVSRGSETLHPACHATLAFLCLSAEMKYQS